MTNNRTTLSSNPILRATLIWGALAGLAVLVLAVIGGFLISGIDGLWSGVLGALVGVVFPALTAVTILVANRWYGSPSYLQIFFGVVLGGWLLKFVLVIVLLLSLLQLEWIDPIVFFAALVLAAVASLVVDLVVMSRMRLPAVSDIALPGDEDNSTEKNPS